MRRLHTFFVSATIASLVGACGTAGTTSPVGAPASPDVASQAAPATGTPPGAVTPRSGAAQAGTSFPNRADSLKFVVFGDFGTGDRDQYELAARMNELHATFPFELATLVGDNLYGSERPQDFKRKFEEPYKPLLDKGVKFYASLGNHDAREQRFYKLFNMGGELYYTFKAPRQSVRFFALESTYLEPEQVEVARTGARGVQRTTGRSSSSTTRSTRRAAGTAPTSNSARCSSRCSSSTTSASCSPGTITSTSEPGRSRASSYFVAGSGGKLRKGDFRPNLPFSAKIVADTHAFLAVEIDGDTMTFKAIARDGRVVDSGEIARRETSDASSR